MDTKTYLRKIDSVGGLPRFYIFVLTDDGREYLRLLDEASLR